MTPRYRAKFDFAVRRLRDRVSRRAATMRPRTLWILKRLAMLVLIHKVVPHLLKFGRLRRNRRHRSKRP